jgi:predicted Zn-dependent protease
MRRFLVLAVATCFPALGGDNPPPIDEALLRLYDFNFPATHEILTQYIAANPNDPLPHAFRASAYLFSELDRMGILESEFLIDDQRIAEKKRALAPDPAVRKQFLKALEEAQKRGDAALKANPDDRAALFAMCVAQGVATDYMALVEKRQFSSLSLAKRSNNYAQRLLKLDPRFYDAYLTAGLTEYMVGSLPFFIRWFVRFDNVAGNKERGKEILERVAREGHYFKAFAKILLGIIDLREKRPQDAQKLLAELAHDYPNNPLFRKELAKLNSRLGVAAN